MLLPGTLGSLDNDVIVRGLVSANSYASILGGLITKEKQTYCITSTAMPQTTAVACQPRLFNFLLKRVKKSGMEALSFLTQEFLSY